MPGAAAVHHINEDTAALLRAGYPRLPDHASVGGRVILTGDIVQVDDVLDDPEIDKSVAKFGKFRSTMGVPLISHGRTIDTMNVAKRAVGPFKPRQIELIKTFAEQAVIAIENARLFGAEQTRTRELQESLEYQTAAGDVLSVISSSPDQLQPVIDVIVKTAARLCDADYSLFFQDFGEGFVVTAGHNADPEIISYFNANPLVPTRGSIVGRTALTVLSH
jgi:two-component system NtrC family sensor kinase